MRKITLSLIVLMLACFVGRSQAYMVDQTGTFAPIDISATGTNVALGDDAVSGDLPIGFSFDFYGNTYTDFRISSNGFIGFGGLTDNGCCSGEFLPNASASEPSNMICFAWEDLDPGNGGQPAQNVVRYETVGVAPNRILVVEFFNVDHFSSGNQVTAHTQLYEGSNLIEIHTTAMPSDGGSHTQGVENMDSTEAVVTPGRNATSWSAFNDYVAYIPLTPPLINCPMDIMANTDPGVCTAQVSFADAVAIDPEGGTVTVTQTMGPASGSDFPIGDTIIEFTATNDDAPNETATCQFTITVVDNEPPTITCPADVVVDNDPGVCGANVTVPMPTVMDNCVAEPGATLVNDYNGTNDASDFYPAGTTTVTWTYTDQGGNMVQCTHDVIVNDVEPPTVSCVGSPGTITVSEDFDAGLPAGWSTVINTGTCDWQNGTDLPTGDDFTTPAMFFDDDDCGLGAPASNVSLVSDVYDTTGATTVTLGYDVAFQEAGGGSTGTVEVFDGAAWQQVALYNVDLDPDIQTESLDITAYSNAALQVRWTYDDNGAWGWHYGVDNFALDYAVPATPLDVVLDANGMASIPASDLVLAYDDNCGAGGVTILGGSGGGGLYDQTINIVNPALMGTNVFSFAGTPTGASADATLEVMTFGDIDGTGGNEEMWTITDEDSNVTGTIGATGSFADQCNTTLTETFMIPAAMIDAWAADGMIDFTGTDVAGNINTVLCGGDFLQLRLTYPTGGSTMVDFTCDDLGLTQVTVTAVDGSGNESSCIATVNVIDDTPPVLVCQDVTIELGPDGTADINPEDLLASSPSTYDVVTISSDNQSGTEGFTDLTVPVTAAEVVSFDWDYTTPDGPAFDSFGYLINGVYTELTDPGGALQQSGNSGPINLAPGDVFGFRSYSLDGLFGACTTTVSNFVPGFNGQFDPANWTVTLTNSDGDAFFVEIPGGPLSFDACGITVLAVDITEVTCDDIGTDYDETITITNPALMSSNVFSFTGTPTGATADAVLEVMTFGDIDGTGGNEEMWTITDEDSNTTGTIGATGNFGDQCSTTLTETFMIPAAMIDAWAADGQIDFTGTDVAGNINTVLCGGDFLSLRLTYSTGGNLTATVFASDASGNLAACQSMITVVDALAPEVTCPADQTVDPGPGNLFYTVPDYWAGGDATATDNCTDPVTVFTQDPPAGSQITDGVYTVTLCATDEYGNEGCCTFELTVESILGAADNELGSAISMYPNPAAEQITLANGSNILLDNAVIYDMNGKLVNTIDLRNMGSEMVIDVSQLASGVYMVQITGEESTTVKRLIKE
ncbi:MAG: HYR domain-containing protein [Flavobacterium sp.]|nr:MAG: HYR domain-containing protein [Flavobacterium sp.]